MAIDQHQDQSQIIDLPVIKYSKLVENDPSEVDRLYAAAQVDGFFQLDLSGSDADVTVLQALPIVYQLGNDYFSQPARLKDCDRRQNDTTDRGYDTSSCDETFEISLDEFHAGHPALPSVFAAQRSILKPFMEDLDEACRIMLTALDQSLGLTHTQSLAEYHDQLETSESGLKFITEPTLARKADVGDNLHTDGGTFTIVFCEKFGLHAYLPSIDDWRFIPPRPNCCVVNVADSLSRFTKRKLHSPQHRVTQIEDGAGERLYLSYFLRPSHRYVLRK